MIILAIDPGPVESGYALIEADTRRPVEVGKVPNDDVLAMIINTRFGHLAIEMVQSFGMSVGADVFDTCVWIGRYLQRNADNRLYPGGCDLVKRDKIKLHHCHAPGAKDSNVSQALRDRFAYGVSNYGKGTKAEPGWFYGFSKDAWQAYALAVYVADTRPA